MSLARKLLIFTISAAALDAALKLYFLLETPIFPGKILAFYLYQNPGIAFSLRLPYTLIILISIIAFYMLAKEQIGNFSKNPIKSQFAFMALVGGLGNFFDRVLNEHVIDYLIFFNIYAINISDILIVLGILGLILYSKSNSMRKKLT